MKRCHFTTIPFISRNRLRANIMEAWFAFSIKHKNPSENLRTSEPASETCCLASPINKRFVGMSSSHCHFGTDFHLRHASGCFLG
jgi:hypothetical protein